jgi:hypothetical protein
MRWRQSRFIRRRKAGKPIRGTELSKTNNTNAPDQKSYVHRVELINSLILFIEPHVSNRVFVRLPGWITEYLAGSMGLIK